MLGGDKKKAETLRNLKSALLNEAIAQNARNSGLSDDQMQKVLARESKKRLEAAELYKNANELPRAEVELEENAIIQAYLPKPASEAEIARVIKEEISKMESPSPADIGKLIGATRARVGAGADGAVIARLVKSELSN